MSGDEEKPPDTATQQQDAQANGKAENKEPPEESILLKTLTVDFTYLRELRDAGETGAEACDDLVLPGSRHSITSCTVVNFIDPSSTASKSSPTRGSQEQAAPTIPLFNKLTSYFEEEYGSTLRDVPYKHIRSGESQVIDRILVYPILQGGSPTTSAQGSGVVRSIDRSTSGLSDPSEWHNGPYCHVYIAACDSVEHYRTKVRPSLQAFVSQIEQAAGANITPTKSGDGSSPAAEAAASAAAASSGSSYSAHYVIVFVPTGDKSAHSATGGSGAGSGRRFGSALAGLRQRMRSHPSDPDNAAIAESGSLHTSVTESNTSGELDLDLSDAHGQLSKMEKELLRRFNVDFPNGHVCIMSTLTCEDEGEAAENDGHLRKSEWASFQKCLGLALVDGFKDRCQRYDEELRHLDVQRAAYMNPTSTGEGDSPAGASKFNLVHYFLVKESLAFTYEQMCLPFEALLQYNELRALLPDLNSGAMHRIQNKDQREWTALSEMAVAGDTMGFRRHLAELDTEKQSGDAAMEILDPIAHILERYLFSRDVSLHTKMGDPVKVLSCCRSFVESMFQFKRATIPSSRALMDAVDEDESQRLLADASRWAFDFCWNVKKASDCYLTNADESLHTVDGTDDGPVYRVSSNTAFVRELCEVLDFARLRMLQLGDILLPGDNPVRLDSTTFGLDVTEPWSPWEKPTLSTELENKNSEDDNVGADESLDILDSALSSRDEFEKQYMELAKIIIELNHLAGRLRTASRLETDMLEIHIRRGEKAKAIETLQSIVKTFALDHWNACHFTLLFRLACFQRNVSSAAEYLQTLVHCFSDKLAVTAPPKARDVLQADLEAVIQDPTATDSRFESAPVFDASVGLRGLDPKSSLRQLRSTLKKVFSVGDKVFVSLDVESHLPKGIDVDGLTISFVPFQVYVALLEDSVPLKDEDIVKRLSLQAPVCLQPGTNHYEFEWIPISSGQYILSSILIEWRGSHFVYNTRDIQKMAVRIDVVPCDPTQSVEVKPSFLLPGHEQPVRLEFNAGSDIVKEGSLQLACSPGLLLQPPKESPDTGKWIGACTVPIPPCSPGDTVVFTAQVKSINSDPSAKETEAQRLHAEITTSFLFNHPAGIDLDNISPMTNVLERVIPSLGKPTLLVENVEVVLLSLERVMVCISILCNLPTAFTLKSWKIDLPPTFSLEPDGDLNGSLAQSRVVAGERLSFGFACSIQDRDLDISAVSKASLHVVVEDEHGTVFDEVLGLTFKSPTIARATLSDPPSVAISISPSVTSGPVSEPVNLCYIADTSSLTNLPKGVVLYQVDVDDEDWILSGKAEGGLDRNDDSAVRLEFVAVPIHPGTLSTYPALKLFFKADDPSYGLVPLSTSLDEPASFHATCPTDHMTVAFPV